MTRRRLPLSIVVPIVAAGMVGGALAGGWIAYAATPAPEPEVTVPAACFEAVAQMREVNEALAAEILVPVLRAVEGEGDLFTREAWITTLAPIATASQDADILARDCIAITEEARS